MPTLNKRALLDSYSESKLNFDEASKQFKLAVKDKKDLEKNLIANTLGLDKEQALNVSKSIESRWKTAAENERKEYNNYKLLELEVLKKYGEAFLLEKPKRAPYVNNYVVRTNFSQLKTTEKKELVEQLSAILEIKHSEATRFIEKNEGDLKYQIFKAVKNKMNSRQWTKSRIYIDLETTGFNAQQGEILEIGIIKVSPDGEILNTVNERFDMENKAVRDAIGTGPVDVHKIRVEDIKGRPTFKSLEVQERLGAIVNDPDSIIVAHNFTFENDWLSLHLDGFYDVQSKISYNNLKNYFEGEETWRPYLDTKYTSRFFVFNGQGNTLKDFTSYNGVPYVDAHSAYSDAKMMFDALSRFTDTFSKK